MTPADWRAGDGAPKPNSASPVEIMDQRGYHQVEPSWYFAPHARAPLDDDVEQQPACDAQNVSNQRYYQHRQVLGEVIYRTCATR